MTVSNRIDSGSPILRNNIFRNPFNQYELSVDIPLANSLQPIDVRYNWWGTYSIGQTTDAIRDYNKDGTIYMSEGFFNSELSFSYKTIDSVVPALWNPSLEAAPASCLSCIPPGKFFSYQTKT
jgi:hypothetical protein